MTKWKHNGVITALDIVQHVRDNMPDFPMGTIEERRTALDDVSIVECAVWHRNDSNGYTDESIAFIAYMDASTKLLKFGEVFEGSPCIPPQTGVWSGFDRALYHFYVVG